jgi:Xaa-Pro dipeptidase
LDEEQIKTHFAARDSVDSITAAAFQEIGRRVRNGGTTEHQIQQWFMEAFQRENLVTDDPPIVGRQRHSGDPHYEPRADGPAPIREGDLVLLDVWAKKNVPGCGLLRHHLDRASSARHLRLGCRKSSTVFAMRATPA